jgi:hypothetical protein
MRLDDTPPLVQSGQELMTSQILVSLFKEKLLAVAELAEAGQIDELSAQILAAYYEQNISAVMKRHPLEPDHDSDKMHAWGHG